ncbi:MAG TPA: DJ-1/PfpI family protein [Solirubrobacteraceae bacterium]|nr:DJ-1/PfpI family protein [Solirubrobacteraceae bacterium]
MTQHSSLPLTEVLVFDGFDDLDAIAPLEILTAAGFPTRVVRPAGHGTTVHSAHGLMLHVDGELAAAFDVSCAEATAGEAPCDEATPALVLVPGGGWLDAASGVRDQCEGPLPAALAARHDAGAVMASVCTGAMLLARAGLLSGRPAVTNRNALDDLAAAGADVRRGARVVDDGSVVTAGGPAAGIDLAIRLVARFAGEEAARDAAERVEHEPVGPVLVRVGTA